MLWLVGTLSESHAPMKGEPCGAPIYHGKLRDDDVVGHSVLDGNDFWIHC